MQSILFVLQPQKDPLDKSGCGLRRYDYETAGDQLILLHVHVTIT